MSQQEVKNGEQKFQETTSKILRNKTLINSYINNKIIRIFLVNKS